MSLSREWNLRLNWVLNEIVPPALRDCRWFGALIAWVLYRDKYRHFLNFHDGLYDKSETEIEATYRAVEGARLTRPTDLNAACEARILKDALGPEVLDAGCGSGHLARALAVRHRVSAVDFTLPAPGAHEGITWRQAPLTALPFPDRSFDTVISTHTLEHVRDLPKALAELRRLAKHRLLIVVPKERPHRRTPNLHLHFFPYDFSLLLALNPKAYAGVREYSLENMGGDWFYREDYAEDMPISTSHGRWADQD